MKNIHAAYAGALTVALAAVVPGVAFAQTTLATIISRVGVMLSLLIPIIITLAVVIFFWGLAIFLLKADEEKEKGRSIMLYGILTLFVMIAVWGLVELIANTLGVTPTETPVTIPKVQ